MKGDKSFLREIFSFDKDGFIVLEDANGKESRFADIAAVTLEEDSDNCFYCVLCPVALGVPQENVLIICRVQKRLDGSVIFTVEGDQAKIDRVIEEVQRLQDGN